MSVLDRNIAYAVFARNIAGLRSTVDLAEYVDEPQLDATDPLLQGLIARNLNPRCAGQREVLW
jgi:hypothetical protein